MDSGRDRQVKLPAVKLFHDFIPYSRDKDFNAEFDRLRFFVSKTQTVEDFIKNSMTHSLYTLPHLTLAIRKTLTECITDEQISLLITALYEGNAPAEYYSSLALETIWFSKYSKDASELKAFTRVIDELTRIAQTKGANEIQKINDLIKEFCLKKIYYHDPAGKKILGKGEVYNEALGHLVFMLTNNQISLGGINEGPLQLFFSNTEEGLRLKRGLQAFFLVDPVEDKHASSAPKAGEISFRQLKSFCHVALSGKTSVAPDDLSEKDWLPQVKACYPFYVMYMNQCLTSSASVLCSQIAAEMNQKSASLTSDASSPSMAQPSHWATQFQPAASTTTSFTPTPTGATEQTTPKLY